MYPLISNSSSFFLQTVQDHFTSSPTTNKLRRPSCSTAFLVLGQVSWNFITVYELFAFDRNTWYYITVQTNDYDYCINYLLTRGLTCFYFSQSAKKEKKKDYSGTLKILIVMIIIEDLEMNKISELDKP